MPRHRLLLASLASVSLTVLLGAVGPAGPRLEQSPGLRPGTGSESPAFIDVAVVDGQGKPVTNLSSADFRVTVDGQPRKVLAARYVFRGPGAAAAAQAAAQAARTMVLAEPSRTLVLAVDENSIVRGSEEAVASTANRLLDVLAPADRVTLVSLPIPRTALVLGTDRQPLRDSLARVAGRGSAQRQMARGDERREPDPQAFDDTAEAERTGTDVRSAATDTRPADASPDATKPAATEADAPPLTSPQALTRLLSALKNVAGPKTVIYFWGGASAPTLSSPVQGQDPRLDIDAIADVAAAARAAVHVVIVPRAANSASSNDVERAARDTGGTTTKGADLARLGGVVAGSYLVEFEGRPEDRGRTHAIEIGSSKGGVTVHAARRWLPREDALLTTTEIFDGASMPRAAPPPPAATSRERDRSAAGRGRTPRDTPPPEPDPQLDAILARMLEYLEIYMLDFANVVAEEDYYQRVSAAASRGRSVHLRSDLLLVRTPGPDGWIPFRDVFEVNDQKVRDREDRLRKLFIEKPATAVQEGLRITREGARYNIGRVDRTINLPTLPLVFLMPTHLSKFSLQRKGDEVVEDVPVARLDYEELGRPTVVRQTTTNRDMPSSGSLWVDPLTGRILKTLVRTGDEAFRMEATVVYRRNDALGIWTPAEMKEVYQMVNGTETIFGEAKYSNFRRFQVSTQESITLPK